MKTLVTAFVPRRRVFRIARVIAAPVTALTLLSSSLGAQVRPARQLVDSLSTFLMAHDSAALHRFMDAGFRLGPLEGELASSSFLRIVAGGAVAPTSALTLDSTRVNDTGIVAFVQLARASGTKTIEVQFGKDQRLLELRGLFNISSGSATGNATAATARSETANTYADTALRRRLLGMLADDQRYRLQMATLVRASGVTRAVDSLAQLQQPLDDHNLLALRELVRSRGWPSLRQVGPDAASAAFLVVQHASAQIQEELLPMLERAAAAGDAMPSQAAMLTDRVLVHQGKPQRYGTQLIQRSGKTMELEPMEDPAHVDERRRAVGLQPLAEYLAPFGLKWP
ncbi:MAG: hypothetical protein JWM95_4857 [Gemmatimonadetes bacterium]|nr:hypothetical protein [Gemmatimonadota bacterium]